LPIIYYILLHITYVLKFLKENKDQNKRKLRQPVSIATIRVHNNWHKTKSTYP